MQQSTGSAGGASITGAESTRAVVRGYNDAWAGGDIDGSAAYLDRSGFHWQSGSSTYDDVDEYIKGFHQFARLTSGQTMLSELYGDGEAMLLYDAHSVVGPLRSVEHFTVRNGKIVQILLVWDPTAVRKYQAEQAAKQA